MDSRSRTSRPSLYGRSCSVSRSQCCSTLCKPGIESARRIPGRRRLTRSAASTRSPCLIGFRTDHPRSQAHRLTGSQRRSLTTPGAVDRAKTTPSWYTQRCTHRPQKNQRISTVKLTENTDRSCFGPKKCAPGGIRTPNRFLGHNRKHHPYRQNFWSNQEQQVAI